MTTISLGLIYLNLAGVHDLMGDYDTAMPYYL